MPTHGRGVLWFALPNALSVLSVTAAGVACYLAGDTAFRLVPGIRPVRSRALAVVPVLATAAAGMRLGAAWQLTGLVLVLPGALAAEARAVGTAHGAAHAPAPAPEEHGSSARAARAARAAGGTGAATGSG